MDYVFFHVAVYGFILNPENKLLIVRRAQHDSMPGYWELPGGSLGVDESILQGVTREVLEEVGVEVNVEKPLTVINATPDEKEKPNIRAIFVCSLVNKDAKVVLSKDHDLFDWVAVDPVMVGPLSNSLQRALEVFRNGN